MPGTTALFSWIQEDVEFAKRYARSKAIQAEHLAEEILAIADGDSEDVMRDRLRVDTRKWIAAHLKPSIYGERANETHVSTTVTNNFVVLDVARQKELQEWRREALE